MKDDGRGRFSGVSQFAIGPSDEDTRDRDRRELFGAAGFLAGFAAAAAGGPFCVAALATGADFVFIAVAPEGEDATPRFFPAAAFGAATGRRATAFLTARPAVTFFAAEVFAISLFTGAFFTGAFFAGAFFAGAFFGAAFFGAAFFGAAFFGAAFFAEGFAPVLLAVVTRLETAFAEAAVFRASFLTAVAARRATDFPAEAVLGALPGRFGAFGRAADFREADSGFDDRDLPFEADFLEEAFLFDFNDLPEAEVALRTPDA
ncbi:MAG TPA: hypothetical protein VMS12_13380 [Thermoanaerobaculia bacterium]|nr:hypothetical protein [Thermoanaerobaculia bacterium]